MVSQSLGNWLEHGVVLRSSVLTTSEEKVTSDHTSGFLYSKHVSDKEQAIGRAVAVEGKGAHVIETLNASTACPYFLLSGQPIS